MLTSRLCLARSEPFVNQYLSATLLSRRKCVGEKFLICRQNIYVLRESM